jgi:exosortase/archaeosortase family protein
MKYKNLMSKLINLKNLIFAMSMGKKAHSLDGRRAHSTSAADSIKNYFEVQMKNIRSSQTKQFAFFVLGFALFYLVITGIVGVIPQQFFKESTGLTLSSILYTQGINVKEIGLVNCTELNWAGIDVESTCYSFFANDKQIIISWLCTGVLEIIVLIAAMLASFGISLRKKLYGIIIAVILGVIFNIIRLVVTANLILSQSVGTVELAHDMLFRIVLFFYILGVYVIWFYYSAKEK